MNATVSRRGFLGAAGTASLLAACGYKGSLAWADETAAEPEWTDTADVVVCGAGGAGLNAAYRALELGASVIVLEKSGFTGGTLQFSEGAFQAVCDDEFALDDGTNPVTKNDSIELMQQCWLAMADGDCDEDLVKTLVAKSGEALEWVKSSFGCAVGGTAGIRPVPFVPQETIADRIMYLVDPADPEGTYGHGGKVWMDNAAKAVEDKGGKIVLNAEIVEFLTDENGVVNGVKCLDGSCYKADKGVICCTGGIDHNEVLAKHVNPHHYWMMKHHNLTMVDANTGEGILAGMALGAQTSFHGTDNNPSYFWIGTNKHMMDIIAVGPRGYRFAREDTTYGFWSRCLYNQTRQEGGFDGQVWIVFGDSNFDDNPALQDEAQVQAWYDDGTLVKGETVAELAEKTGLPEIGLQTTLDEWKKCCENQEDPQFGRTDGFGTIDAPYYAMKLIMSTTGAFGGMVIDEQCHVLDYEGNPIPHLFAAGNCSAGWLGDFYYGSGTCLMACAALGMISAENAVAGTYESDPVKPGATGQTDPEAAAAEEADAAPAADASAVADGTYTASGKGIGGDVPVTVTVEGGKITAVEVGENSETQGIGSKAIEQLPAASVEANGTDGVDAVAGATVTSKAIFSAVNDALANA